MRSFLQSSDGDYFLVKYFASIWSCYKFWSLDMLGGLIVLVEL
jgi:hypothetical protein